MASTFHDFYIEKIEKQAKYLKQLRYKDIRPIGEFLATDEAEGFQYPGMVQAGGSSRVMRQGEFWSGRDRYLWLNASVTIPAEWADADVVGVFDFGSTGGGHNSGFESLLFVNGIPRQGVDTNHMEVFFPGSAGSTLNLDFRLWSGLEGGGPKTIQYHQFKQAFIAVLDNAVDELYYFITNMAGTIRILPEDDPARYRLEAVLTEGYGLVDFTQPGSGAFRESARKALDYYRQALQEGRKPSEVSVAFVGHTHIDLSWLWRYKHTREKAERSFSTVMRLMERYPEYKFLQTQAQLYDSVKEDHPELYEEIRKRVAEGRWEASGAMWVEADCNIPSGESLIRQILYGKLFFRQEFAVENAFLWLPDVFGYSWALPQILKKSGINTFITTKISWNETNRLPHDTFMWTGIDGTSILTHFITTPADHGNVWFYTYNGNVLPQTVRGIWTNYQDKALNRDLLLSYGYGDGGGGVNRDMLENLRAISKLPGLPEVRTTTVADYLKNLHRTVASHHSDHSRTLKTWDQELYLEFHRGCYTSQATTKKMNRRLELLYRDAEILQSLLALDTKKWNDPAWAKLREGWKIILKAQFHDIIPGSSITEVYEDTARDHGEAWALGKGVLDEALENVLDKAGQGYAVFNTASWKRAGLVKLPPLAAGERLSGAEGPLVTQTSSWEGDTALYAWVPAAEALEVVNLQVEKGGDAGKDPATSPFKAGENAIESPFYRIKWNSQGQLLSIFDKESGRETLSGPGNELIIFEDRPRMSDAWEIEANVDQKKESIGNLIRCEVLETGPLFAVVRFEWSWGSSRISQDMVLSSVHKRIDFKTTVDWQERSKLLKAAFPVDVRATSARYDIQNGSLERPSHRSTSWDEAQFEVVGHQWADFSETGFGVALMNDSKYGYDVRGNTMRLSLLKSAEHPDTQADRGGHQFTYALYVHQEPWYDSALIPLAWDLNAPLIAAPGSAAHPRLLNISGAGTALDAIKKSEEGEDLIIRLHEVRGGKTRMELSFQGPVSWAEADLMEQPLGAYQRGAAISRDMRPFEIVTFRVRI